MTPTHPKNITDAISPRHPSGQAVGAKDDAAALAPRGLTVGDSTTILPDGPQGHQMKILGRAVTIPTWREIQSREDRLFRFFIGFFATIHFLIFAVQGISFWHHRQLMIDEWTMDADLIADSESGAPKKNALPNAEQAPEAKVSDRTLPQLPKKFTIEDTPPPTEEKTFLEKKDQKPGEDKVAPVTEPVRTPNLTRDLDEQNRVKKDDALKRLALESLRLQKKTDKENKAEEKGDAKLADKSDVTRDVNTGSSIGIPDRSSFRRYRSLLQGAVRRHYTLPEAYNFKNADIKAVVSIIINENGGLSQVKLAQSSGDGVFDNLVLDAVKASVPLPQPPKDMVGQVINVQFSPNAM